MVPKGSILVHCGEPRSQELESNACDSWIYQWRYSLALWYPMIDDSPEDVHFPALELVVSSMPHAHFYAACVPKLEHIRSESCSHRAHALGRGRNHPRQHHSFFSVDPG